MLKKANSKIIDYAKAFAEQHKQAVIDSASKGFTGTAFKISDREDEHILKHPAFLKTLETELDGCKVTIIQKKHSNIINQKWTTDHLLISWKDEDHADNTTEAQVSYKEGN